MLRMSLGDNIHPASTMLKADGISIDVVDDNVTQFSKFTRLESDHDTRGLLMEWLAEGQFLCRSKTYWGNRTFPSMADENKAFRHLLLYAMTKSSDHPLWRTGYPSRRPRSSSDNYHFMWQDFLTESGPDFDDFTMACGEELENNLWKEFRNGRLA